MQHKFWQSHRFLAFIGLLYVLAVCVSLVWFFGPSGESKSVPLVPILTVAAFLVFGGVAIVILFVNRTVDVGILERAYRQAEVVFAEQLTELGAKATLAEQQMDKLKAAIEGYSTLSMPESDKPMFIDLLRGFEEFSAIRGFPISFSVQNTESGKISFKITIRSEAKRSEAEFQIDWKDYIARVGRGDDLSDLPVVLPFVEHQSLLLALRNRNSFLQHTYKAQKNVIEFYEQMFLKLPNHLFSGSIQTLHLHDKAQADLGSYSAIGSTQVAQGRNNKLSENTSTVKIGITYKERIEQVQHLEKLISKIEAELTASKERDDSIRMLKNVGDELTKERPETSRVKEWLATAKSFLQTISLGSETIAAAKKTWDSFGI